MVEMCKQEFNKVFKIEYRLWMISFSSFSASYMYSGPEACAKKAAEELQAELGISYPPKIKEVKT